jgi:hypothetical protein
MFEESKDAEAITSYTMLVEAVQVTGSGSYVTISPRFERIWLESKRRLRKYVADNRPILDYEASMLFACTPGRKSTSRRELNALRWSSFEKS